MIIPYIPAVTLPLPEPKTFTVELVSMVPAVQTFPDREPDGWVNVGAGECPFWFGEQVPLATGDTARFRIPPIVDGVVQA